MTAETRLRLGHCCPDAPNVDGRLDGTTRFPEVVYGTVSDYATVEAGDHELTLSPSGSTAAVAERTVSLAPDAAYTVLATGLVTDIEATLLRDDHGTVPADAAALRLVHASPDAPAVSLAVGDGAPLLAGVEFRSASDYERVAPGDTDLSVRPVDRGRVAASLAADLTAGTAVSVLVVGQLGTGTFEAVVVEDTTGAVSTVS